MHSRELKVAAKTPIAADTLKLRLVAADGEMLPAFSPGAHIEIAIGGYTRRYSLVSSPHDLAAYEICVLRVPDSRGGSAYIHEELAIGDEIGLVGGQPMNAFALDTQAERTLFIAGGIGITPFYTMMDTLAGAGKSFELHYAARDKGRLLPVPDYPAATRCYTDTDGKPELDLDRLLAGADRSAHIYVCGPRGMIEAVRRKAETLGWPPAHVHFESFGAGARLDDEPLEVKLALSGETVSVAPGTSILDALLEAGAWVSYECRRGECGSCAAEIVSGDADHRDVCLTEKQRKSTLCTCVSWARAGRLTLNL